MDTNFALPASQAKAGIAPMPSAPSAPSINEQDRITVVIPFKATFTKLDAVIRLVANCLHLRRMGFRSVMVADGSTFKWPIRLLTAALGAKHVAVDCPGCYSPSTIKNAAAARACNDGHLLFLDVDVLLTERAVHSVRQQVSEGVAFSWVPVVFLDRPHSTGRMLRHGIGGGIAPDIRKRVQVGYTTGIQLIEIGLFRALGGYREAFQGYGCEDIEMIHRATGALDQRPVFERGSDYYLDVRSHDLSALAGFRKCFYEMRKDIPLASMPLHFWHKRKNKTEYMRKRKINDQLLIEMMVDFDARRSHVNWAESIAPERNVTHHMSRSRA